MVQSLIARIVYHPGLTGFSIILILIAIFLLFVWKYKVENFKNLLSDPAKMDANFKNLFPASLLIALGVAILLGPATRHATFDEKLPVLASLFIVNETNEEGRIVCGSQEEVLEPRKNHVFEIHSDDPQPSLQLWLGDRMLVDTLIEAGSFIGSFGGDINVVAEEIVFQMPGTRDSSAAPGFVFLSEPGIRYFQRGLNGPDVYGFDKPHPETVELYYGINQERRWDVKAVTNGEFVLRMLEYMGGASGEED